MPRHIDADALIEEIDNTKTSSIGEAITLSYVRDFIIGAPTADVRENVRGKWLRKFESHRWVNNTCSNCGWAKIVDIHVSLDYNYCPYCGADMRGEEDGQHD